MIDLGKLKEVKERFHALNELLADPANGSRSRSDGRYWAGASGTVRSRECH